MKLRQSLTIASVIVGGVACILWFTRTPRSMAPPLELSSQTERPTQSIAPESAVPRTTVDEHRSTVAPSENLTTSTAARTTLDILAIDGLTSAPLANAEIRGLSSEDLANDDARDEFGYRDIGAIDRALSSAPLAGRTDEHGSLRVELNSTWQIVTAKFGERWGATSIDASIVRSAIVVALYPDECLRIFVVDSAGDPIGKAKVRIRPTIVAMGQGERADEVTAWTDAETGIATATHMRWLMRERTQSCNASVLALLEKPVAVPISLAQLGGPPIRVELPTCGSVRAQLTDRDGAPFRGEALFLLDGAHNPRAADGSTRISPVRSLRTISKDGNAYFALVECGLKLTCEARSDAPRRKTSVVRAGPVKSHDEVLLSLALADPTVVEGRAVNSLGATIASTAITIANDLGEFASPTRTVQSNADGMFRVEADDGARELRWTLRIPPNADPLTSAPMTAHCTVALPRETPRVSMGDVVFREESLLARGTVVDEEGRAVAAMRVAAIPQLTNADGQPRAKSRSDVTVRADADDKGRFVLWGNSQSATLDLIAEPRSESNRYGERKTVPRGSTDVVLLIRRSGVIAGRVLLDDAVVAREIAASVIYGPISSASTASAFVLTPTDEGAAFRLVGLPHGPASLRFSTVGAGETLATIENIEIPAGSAAIDARLDPVDLRGIVRTILITLRAEDGTPIPRATIWWSNNPSQRGWYERQCRQVGARFLVRNANLDVWVHANGYRTLHVEHVTSDREIVLARGIEVRVALDTSLTPRNATFECTLLPVRAALNEKSLPEEAYSATAVFDDRGVATLFAPESGTFAVKVSKRSADGLESGPGVMFPNGPQLTIESDDQALVEYRVADPRVYTALEARR